MSGDHSESLPSKRISRRKRIGGVLAVILFGWSFGLVTIFLVGVPEDLVITDDDTVNLFLDGAYALGISGLPILAGLIALFVARKKADGGLKTALIVTAIAGLLIVDAMAGPAYYYDHLPFPRSSGSD
jgi:hypothetical protein